MNKHILTTTENIKRQINDLITKVDSINSSTDYSISKVDFIYKYSFEIKKILKQTPNIMIFRYI